mmetsp:Transcript_113531/g.360850  ORF Transcript_113531/g.360850 Transcript_113531/m.360850 type:complete len:250 (-) Transcript_113531:94-843(-)
MPNSARAPWTHTCKLYHCTKMITFALGSPAKISFSVVATTLSFEPYFAKWLRTVSAGISSPSPAPPAPSSNSSARGCTSGRFSGVLQRGHWLCVASDAFRQGTQKTWAQGVMAMRCTDKLSDMQMLQLLACASCDNRLSVVEKKLLLTAASFSSDKFFSNTFHVSFRSCSWTVAEIFRAWPSAFSSSSSLLPERCEKARNAPVSRGFGSAAAPRLLRTSAGMARTKSEELDAEAACSRHVATASATFSK